jgi:zinc finger protein
LDLEVGAHSLGGRFTTVEGLITSMRDQLSEKNSLFSDSSDPKTLQALNDFLKKMDEFIKVREPFTLILDDPAGNSYVQVCTLFNFILFNYNRKF